MKSWPKRALEPPWGLSIGKSSKHFNPIEANDQPLAAYRAKRSADRSPEPFAAGTSRPLLFVVQQHGARRLHWDLRLEWRGVLLSWAVPKGPSLDPAEKRLAVQVEDHPVDYADFEGVIPAENYGAGPVIVWDIGRWIPLDDPDRGLEEGKLLFDLAGYKLRGRFTLVRTRGGDAAPRGRSWLWIKKADAFADPDANRNDESVLSGRTLEELSQGSRRADWIAEELARVGAPRKPLRSYQPMLATACDQPFSKAGWIFEPKYDGFRLIVRKTGSEGQLLYRSGRDATRIYPEIARAVEALPYPSFVADGELVVLDSSGRPSFQDLGQRAHLTRRRDIDRASIERPAVLYLFDLLAYDGVDLRGLPAVERKRLLEGIVPSTGPLRFVPHFAERGEDLYREAVKLGFEGVVAKRADSPYRSGRRSGDWLKVRRKHSADVAIVGLSPPKGSRPGFGALHVATPHSGGLRYVGRVGSGFSDRDLRELNAALRASQRADPSCEGPLPQGRSHIWVEPTHVCEVRFAELTREGLLRQPVFVRLRPDKTPSECESIWEGGREEGPAAAQRDEPDPQPEATLAEADPPDVAFTNLEKIFWPETGFAKRDLIAYYRRMAPWLLPYLADRPVVLTRYPDGILGKSFFQKDAPAWVPDWVRTETLWSEHAEREIHYFVCDRLETLLFLANLGTIPLHIWSSRVAALARPDWCILDLDPKEAPFEHVIEVALCLRQFCAAAALPCYVKTSGSTGLHILIPLGEQLSYAQSRSLAELLARLVVAARPEIATVARPLRARKGRVYIDYLQNGHGRLLVAPFSLRPLPEAPVSMPLRWREVKRGLDPQRYTLRNAARRMAQLGEDPLRPVLEERPDLRGALERLAALDSGVAGAAPRDGGARGGRRRSTSKR